ncbi:MAG: murein L,D-transpeptidase [Verrucomicrobia bacterium]|nr:MAG: murein L,D-transpeptidase [Verrucomicrobiota bacterium]
MAATINFWVNAVLRFAVVAALISSAILPAAAKKKATRERTPSDAEIEAATRLQIFLYRANFSPGNLNGHYGDFTWKALALYRISRGEQPQQPPPQVKSKGNIAPDINGLDLASVDPVFITYTVTDADLQSVGPSPSGVAAQAKLKFLPYHDAAEAIAEKFHSEVHLLEQLNPGKMKTIKAGDQIMVPNVDPFELASVKDIKPGSDIAPQAANDIEDQPDSQKGNEDASKGANTGQSAAPPIAVKIDTKTNMLEVHEGDKLIAAYPVTIGSAHTASPIGEWKVSRITKMPTFRYDKEMLQHGKRSGNFHLLPPGPNNPVGVMWIALNKKGIGIHGTNSPDSIGRAASHGCIRLANWDVVRLATKIRPGETVSIR